MKKVIYSLLVAGLFLANGSVVSAAPNSMTSDVFLFSGGTVEEATASLRTSDKGATASFQTSDLPGGHAYTMWWVIFNHPENCTEGEDGFRCGSGDFMNEAVEPALVNATGHVIGQTGYATFNAQIKAGENDRALVGSGLTNPTGADIHLVIKDHGPPVPGLVSDQISTLGGGCTTSFVPDGEPGDYECMDLQFAVFEQ